MQEPSFLDSAVGGMLLGSPAWVDRMRKELAEQPESHEVPARHRLAWRPSVDVILDVVSRCHGVDGSAMLERCRRGNDARMAALCLCRRLTDERVGSLATRFGGVSPAAVTKSVTRGEARCSTDADWDRHLAELEAQVKSRDKAKRNATTTRRKR